MTRRTEQLSSVIHRAVQSVLSEGMSDPRLQCVVTITEVRVTDDLMEAIIGVSIMPAKFEPRAIHALADASNFIRREASERVAMARMPRLVFKLDRSAKRQAAVFEALAQVAKEREGQSTTDAPVADPDSGSDTPTPPTT